MLKLLVPCDGSPAALRAVQHAASLAPLVCDLEVHLINIQEPMHAWEVRRFLTEEEITAMQRKSGEEALTEAKTLLENAGIRMVAHIVNGEVSDTIAAYARNLDCQQIVMGTRGMGALEGLLLGSVSTKVLHKVDRPVILVK